MQSLFREKRLMGSNDHIVEREQTGQDIIIDNLIPVSYTHLDNITLGRTDNVAGSLYRMGRVFLRHLYRDQGVWG